MNTNSGKRSLKYEIFDLIKFTLVILAIVIPIRAFIAQPFIVNGESMVPTFENGDYLIIDEISYRGSEPERGDVIVFRFPTDQKRFLIKRVIGLPGEEVIITGNKITVTKNDGEIVQLYEDYLNGEFSSYGTWELRENEYFVLGDNRQKSSDSRQWGIVTRDLIVGKTLLRLFPLSGLKWRPGTESSSSIETVLE